MVSFAFLLCSALLLSGAIAAPHPDETDDINEIVSKLRLRELPSTDTDTDISEELQRSLGQEAAQAGVKVLIDFLDGKDLQKSMLDRGIEALEKVDGTLVSYGRMFLKFLRDWMSGTPIEKIAGNIWQTVHGKFVGKNKTYDEIVEAIGVDNVTKFVENSTKLIKDYIVSVIKKKKDQKALKAFNKWKKAARIAVAGH